MQNSVALLDTTIGKKALIALTGLVLFGFVVQHMFGNLQVFLGREVYDHYAEALKGSALLLWGVRGVLLASVVVHVWLTLELYVRSNAARPVEYRSKKLAAASYASVTMKYSGPALLFYILFHIAHFTAPGLSFGDVPFNASDPYGNFVSSFQVPWVTAFYVIANLYLGLHLYHGSWSLFQSLGVSHPRYDALRRGVGITLALVVTAGNVAMPLAVFLGVIR